LRVTGEERSEMLRVIAAKQAELRGTMLANPDRDSKFD
jgi:hypothetical protein